MYQPVRFLLPLIALVLVLPGLSSIAMHFDGNSLYLEDVTDISSILLDTNDEPDDINVRIQIQSDDSEFEFSLGSIKFHSVLQVLLRPDARAPPHA